MRVILFTGKGGVGKTTVACATAVSAARRGESTLVMSTDPAHSLADCLGVELNAQASEIEPKLWALQLDATVRMEQSWLEIRGYLEEVFRWAGLDAIQAEELAILPGFEEIFSLTDIHRHATSGDFDTIVVDCAPTGETIRLLSMPDVLHWYMDKAFPMSRRVNRAVGPLVARLTSLPVADDEVFGAVERLYTQLSSVRDLLRDPTSSSVRLVTQAEKMVVAEARRTYTYLSLFGYHTDAVIVNRLLPDSMTDPWFDHWRSSQRDQLTAITEGFDPLPILHAELSDRELLGAEALHQFAQEIYGDTDPTAIHFVEEPFELHAEGDVINLTIKLAHVDKSELDLGRVGDELFIKVGPYRRAVLLPDSLRRRSVASAKFVGDRLVVGFALAQ